MFRVTIFMKQEIEIKTESFGKTQIVRETRGKEYCSFNTEDIDSIFNNDWIIVKTDKTLMINKNEVLCVKVEEL